MTIIIDQKPKNVKNPTTQYIIVRKSQHKNKAIEKIDNNKLSTVLFFTLHKIVLYCDIVCSYI